MTDVELVQYIETHSKTERALFDSNMLKRFFKITGAPYDPGMYGFYSFPYEHAKPFIDRAYLVLRAVGDEATVYD